MKNLAHRGVGEPPATTINYLPLPICIQLLHFLYYNFTSLSYLIATLTGPLWAHHLNLLLCHWLAKIMSFFGSNLDRARDR